MSRAKNFLIKTAAICSLIVGAGLTVGIISIVVAISSDSSINVSKLYLVDLGFILVVVIIMLLFFGLFEFLLTLPKMEKEVEQLEEEVKNLENESQGNVDSQENVNNEVINNNIDNGGINNAG